MGQESSAAGGAGANARMRVVVWPLLLLLLGMGLAYGAAVLERLSEREREREEVRMALEPIRGALSRELFRAIELTEGLAVLIAVDGGITDQKFDSFAGMLTRNNGLILDVAIAPGNVVTRVYPAEGTERVVGLDYAKNEEQWPGVARMMKERRLVVAGPVNLVQGGVGVIGRSPVYVDGQYWGLVATVVDFDKLLAQTRLMASDRRITAALRGVDGVGNRGAVFWGTASVFDQTPVVVDVPLPSGSWGLAAMPRGGWTSPSLFASTYFIAGSLLALVLAGFLFKVLQAGYVRDAEVAHRKDSERALSEREQRLSSVYETVGDVIFHLAVEPDEHYRFISVNPAFSRVLGLPDEAVVGKRVREVMPQSALSLMLEKHREAVEGKRLVRWEQTALYPVGQLSSEITVAPVFDDRGECTHLVGSLHDVTQRKQAEAQLIVADRLAALGMLAAGVAHEINNPLAAVMANLDLALDDLSKGESADMREQLEDARDCAVRIRTIVRDLGIFSRAEKDERGPVDIARVLDSTLRMVSNELRHRAHLVRQVTDDIPPVLASESRLGQVFLNLIVNAVHAVPAGRAEDNEIRISTRVAASGEVVVEVSDTGTGMSPETLERLFTPFFTTKPAGSGTGLGLAICQRIVTGLGGRIEVDSELGVGTSFRVYLVAAREEIEARPAPKAVAPAARRRGRLLVIDDERMVANAIKRMLSTEHEVVATTVAREAMGLLEAGEQFDVILCDLMMPDVTGMELHAAAVRSAPDQAERMVFMTGGAFTDAAREFLARVPNARFEKPFDHAHLRTLVNERVG